MNQPTQEVSISSNPTGATVVINGQTKGKTPMVADLKRKNTQLISIQLDGFSPYEVALSRSVSGWVWGNIAFGGIVGLVVDLASGSIYNLRRIRLWPI